MAQWRPIFDETERAPYRDAIAAIVRDLSKVEVPGLDWSPALLPAYLAKSNLLASGLDATSWVAAQLALLEEVELPARLYSGAAGVGWLCAHLDALSGGPSTLDYEELDTAFVAMCANASQPCVYDLIGGLVGYGVYLVERGPGKDEQRRIDAILDGLANVSERSSAGRMWLTSHELLADWQKEEAPSGCYNLGVAHGSPGVIGLLADIVHSQLDTSSRAKDLLHEAAYGLLGLFKPDGTLPFWVFREQQSAGSRLAWCYGELGAAACLLSAARALDDQSLESFAVENALRSASRRDTGGVKDPGLCHGATGNAHIFNRWFQTTGRVEFKDAARYWFRRSLQMRRPSGGIGGFFAWNPKVAGQWHADPQFLTGGGGIALSYLAAITPLEPAWDRVLLLKMPSLDATKGRAGASYSRA